MAEKSWLRRPTSLSLPKEPRTITPTFTCNQSTRGIISWVYFPWDMSPLLCQGVFRDHETFTHHSGCTTIRSCYQAKTLTPSTEFPVVSTRPVLSFQISMQELIQLDRLYCPSNLQMGSAYSLDWCKAGLRHYNGTMGVTLDACQVKV